jgi:hypothetical protein
MFRIIHVPPVLDQFFSSLKPCFQWVHCGYFRPLVLEVISSYFKIQGARAKL